MIRIILLAALLTGCGFQSDLDAERKQYCEMVALWESSEGKAGWPNYNGENCDV